MKIKITAVSIVVLAVCSSNLPGQAQPLYGMSKMPSTATHLLHQVDHDCKHYCRQKATRFCNAEYGSDPKAVKICMKGYQRDCRRKNC